MPYQATRIFLYSSIAIFLMTIAWGARQIPAQGQAIERVLSESLDQELIVLGGAVKASTQALKYRLLDVLKAEGNDHATRTFEDSPFIAASLLEWDQVQWKSLWYSVKSKTDFQSGELKNWLKEWPLSKLAADEVYFAKIGDVQGQPYFVVLVPVRRPNQIPMVGVGIFPAAQFGLSFSADENREIRVFNQQGFALALAHPAYLGTSIMSEPVVTEIVERDEIRVRHEWLGARGTRMIGVANKLGESNLYAAIETKAQSTASWPAWLYLILCGVGGCALNWVLFNSVLRSLLRQLNLTEAAAEQLRRQVSERANSTPGMGAPLPRGALAKPALAGLDFSEVAVPAQPNEGVIVETPAAGKTSIVKVLHAALKALDGAIRDQKIHVIQFGLENLYLDAEPLQLQTAIEEILKNGLEAMTHTETRKLTISGQETESGLRLTVQDTGSGIPAGDLDKVFDPFFSSKDSQGVARGLGLNVVRRVIEELDGVVKIHSSQDSAHAGTRVEIEWPRQLNVAPAPSSSLQKIGRELDELVNEIGTDGVTDGAEAEIDLNEELVTVHTLTKTATKAAIRPPEWSGVPMRKPLVRTLD